MVDPMTRQYQREDQCEETLRQVETSRLPYRHRPLQPPHHRPGLRDVGIDPTRLHGCEESVEDLRCFGDGHVEGLRVRVPHLVISDVLPELQLAVHHDQMATQGMATQVDSGHVIDQGVVADIRPGT